MIDAERVWDSVGMPELPEVESARLVIEGSALGRRIAAVDDSDDIRLPPAPAR